MSDIWPASPTIMTTPTFDHYLRYAELTSILNDFAARFPALCKVIAIGKSYEGRDIWCAVLTNSASRLKYSKRIHIGLHLRRIGSTWREWDYDIETGILRSLLYSRTSAQDD